MKFKDFVKSVEMKVVPHAICNTEGDYTEAFVKVGLAFSRQGITLTENQVRATVNRVWNRVYGGAM